MVKVSILYPRAENSTFDIDYYLATHIPLCLKRMGAAVRKVEVDEGVGGSPPGSPAPFMAGVHFYFDSEQAFFEAIGPHAAELRADVPNYTNVKPITQISQARWAE